MTAGEWSSREEWYLRKPSEVCKDEPVAGSSLSGGLFKSITPGEMTRIFRGPELRMIFEEMLLGLSLVFLLSNDEESKGDGETDLGLS
jgi:hypothetical protein